MTRLAIPPRVWVSATHVPEARPTCTVEVEDRTPRPTGVLNPDGWMIYDVPETVPLGFKGRPK